MRRRRPDHLIRNLFIASLIILAAMHPAGTGHVAQLATGLALAIVEGIATAAVQHLGATAIVIGLALIARNALTHHPHPHRTY